jgi:mitotic spindle assembly checkpoint protein MAD1
MVTEERDRLKNVVNELKRPKDNRRGDATASGVLQVFWNSIAFHLFSLRSFLKVFLCTLLSCAGA